MTKDFERGVDGQNLKQDVKDLLEADPKLKELMRLEPKFNDTEDDNEIINLVTQTEITASPRP